jgi:hypothetical protein
MYSTPDPAAVQNSPPAPDRSSAAVAADSTLTSNTVYYVTAGDDATDPAADSDPAVTDPANIDAPSGDLSAADSGPDADPDPDAEPDDPEPADDPGRPPFVPLPPAPIGPEAAF